MPAAVGGIAEQLLEPVEHEQLDLRRPAASNQTPAKKLAAGTEPVAQHRDERRCAGDEGEEARVVARG